MATKLADAYVQIIPSAKGIQGSITQALGGESEKAGTAAGTSIASKLKSAIAAAGIGAAITKVVKDSLEAGGNLQQSFGGLDTLYGEASDKAKEFAYAASSIGLSANEYAEQAVSFGASLKQAFGGDAEKAVNAANTAINDMADNAAKMGTPIENIQNAYQGFAKQNYTMLDNLKLGYGGTKSEMERLLKDAQQFSGVKYDIDNLGDVYDAIHVIQGELDLTGVAAGEASTTLTGSFAAMKASATNLLANMSLGESIGPSLTSLISTTKAYLFNNLLPMIGNIVKSIPTIFTTVFQMAAQAITGINWIEAGQNLIGKIKEGLSNLATDVPQAIQDIGNDAKEWFESIDWKETGSAVLRLLKSGITILTNDIPATIKAIGLSAIELMKGVDWLQLGTDIINFIGDGITIVINSIPDAIQSIGETAKAWFEAIDWSSVGKTVIGLLKAGIQTVVIDIPLAIMNIGYQAVKWFLGGLWKSAGGTVIGKIVSGIAEFVMSIPDKIKEIREKAIEYFKDGFWKTAGKAVIRRIISGIVEFFTMIPDKLREIAKSGIEYIKNSSWLASGHAIITRTVKGIKEFFTKIPDKLMEIINSAIDKITDLETWMQVGKDMVNGIVDGIKSIPGAIAGALEGAAKSALDGVKGLLGIASPSKVFRDEVGKPIAWGITEGFNAGAAGLADDMVSQINAAKKAVDTNIGMESRYTMNGRSKQLDNMPYQIAGAVLEGVQQIADGVEKGIGKMKMVANNRETARFVADLGFARS